MDNTSEDKKPDFEGEKLANLYVAVVMNEMKPRSIIPVVKRAFIAGFKANQSELTTLRKEKEELIEAYEEYVKILVDEIESLIGVASVHGWRSRNVELGQQCRNRIHSLKQK